MSIDRLPRTMFVLLLVVAAVVVGSRLGAPVAAGASGRPVAATGHSQANRPALPPLLARATPTELAIIRQVDAQEAAASAYDPPVSARYSLAGLNGYASAGK